MDVIAESRRHLVELTGPLDINVSAAIDDDIVDRRIFEIGLERTEPRDFVLYLFDQFAALRDAERYAVDREHDLHGLRDFVLQHAARNAVWSEILGCQAV